MLWLVFLQTVSFVMPTEYEDGRILPDETLIAAVYDAMNPQDPFIVGAAIGDPGDWVSYEVGYDSCFYATALFQDPPLQSMPSAVVCTDGSCHAFTR